jgi:SAM-dependent methyltransferase
MNSGGEDSAAVESARAYEELFVPALFGQWATRVADAADLKPGRRVLDVACGTGVLAREAAKRVGASGQVVGLDANAGMLAVARELAPSIEWRNGDVLELPFEDRMFDAVVCQFGLMFFSDRTKAIREMMRVLRPGGRLAVAVWDSLKNTPAYAADVAMLQRVAGSAAADALRAPFVLGDRTKLRQLFADAGAPPIELQTVAGTARFPSLKVMMEADLRGWLPVMGVTLEEALIQRLIEESQAVLGKHVLSDGTMAFDSPALLVSTIKPDA